MKMCNGEKLTLEETDVKTPPDEKSCMYITLMLLMTKLAAAAVEVHV